MVNIIKEKWNNNDGANKATGHRWWLAPDESLFNEVTAIVNRLAQESTATYANYVKFARLYSNQDFVGFGYNNYMRSSSSMLTSNRLTLNVIKSCVDTAASKIAKSRPRAYFLTSGGDFEQQQRAKNLTKYTDGLFDELDTYQIGQQSFVDACVFGLGAVKIFQNGDRVGMERVLPFELLFDQKESIYGNPRQLHQVKYVDRYVVAAMFPEHKIKIMAASPGKVGDYGPDDSDMLAVTESWRLSSDPEAADGRHCITINNCTLLSEKWERSRFPFAFLRWSNKLVGFVGEGLCEELVGIQIEINKILINIQKAQHLIAVPRVYMETSSKINSQHINNEIGSVIKFNGQAPIFQTPVAMNSEIYQHLDRLYNKAYEITGVSQLSATSKKPAGLDAAVALREYQDIESERFALVGQRYERFFMEIARQVISQTQLLSETNKKIHVKLKSNKSFEKIDWKAIKYDEAAFVLRVFPTSLLPTSPGGKMQWVQEMMQGGLLDREDALALLDFPDIEGATSLATAPTDDIKNTLERIIEDGEYDTPEEYQNLDLCIKLAQSYYLRARTSNVPEDRLELLRRFIDDCDYLVNQKNAKAPSAPLAPPVAMAQPEAPPVSELLPTLPQGV